MVSDRVLSVMNVSLGLIIILLVLNFVGVELPTLGKAQYLLDKEDPLCIVNSGGEFTPWNDLDRCCLEARKQISCENEMNQLQDGRTDWTCGFKGNGYLLNNKAYNYCRQQPYW